MVDWATSSQLLLLLLLLLSLSSSSSSSIREFQNTQRLLESKTYIKDPFDILIIVFIIEHDLPPLGQVFDAQIHPLPCHSHTFRIDVVDFEGGSLRSPEWRSNVLLLCILGMNRSLLYHNHAAENASCEMNSTTADDDDDDDDDSLA